MKYSKQLLLTTTLLASSLSQAVIINFITMANTVPGEGGHDPLNFSAGGIGVKITGNASIGDNDSTQYAYLDKSNDSNPNIDDGGLGVCRDINGSDQCTPSNDDNVTTYEKLTFKFDKAVKINTLWFNNQHDGGFAAGAKVNIEGDGYLVSLGNIFNNTGGISDNWGTLAAGDAFVVKYHNSGCGENDDNEIYSVSNNRCNGTQFYVSGMDVSEVPEPSSLALLSLGCAALGLMRRRWA